jgi:hypothetical protein
VSPSERGFDSLALRDSSISRRPPCGSPQLGFVALALLASMATTAHAGVVFYATEPAFDAAIASGYVAMGVQDWSSAGNAPIASVGEPLQPGVANGVFPNGTNPATGMTVQSNSHVTSGNGVAPGAGLFYAPTGFTGLSAGADDITVYSVPEISAAASGLLAVLVLGGVVRMRAGSKLRSWITSEGASARATTSSAGV